MLRLAAILVVVAVAAATAQPLLAAEALDPSVDEGSYQNLFSVIRGGGLLMAPILGCSFVMLVFAFERFISLRGGRVVPGPFVKRFLQQIREGMIGRDEAIELCMQNGSPAAAVFSAAIRKWGRSCAEVEQALLDEGERVAGRLRRHLVIFNGVATVSPLLGLLGTVFGMIRTFNAIAQADAMGRPELLAGGISEALVTTAAGLCVAIPALILYLYFASRVDRMVMRIDELGAELVEMIAAGGTPRPSPSSSRAAAKKARRPASAA